MADIKAILYLAKCRHRHTHASLCTLLPRPRPRPASAAAKENVVEKGRQAREKKAAKRKQQKLLKIAAQVFVYVLGRQRAPLATAGRACRSSPSFSVSQLDVCVCVPSSLVTPVLLLLLQTGLHWIGFSHPCGFSALCFALLKRLIKTLIAAIKKLFSSLLLYA